MIIDHKWGVTLLALFVEAVVIAAVLLLVGLFIDAGEMTRETRSFLAFMWGLLTFCAGSFTLLGRHGA